MQVSWELLLGPYGCLVALIAAVAVLWLKLGERDRALAAEHEARLQDAKKYSETIVKLTKGLHHAVDRLGSLTNGMRPPT